MDKQNYFTYTDNTSDGNDKTMESLHKQIMIDGVDVSECPYYIHKDGSCSSHDCECVKCVHNVCFYKDYKAKEQELEQYKRSKQASYEAIQAKCNELELENRELKAVHSTNVALSDELFKYKAENDKLKEARKNSRCAWKSLEDTLCPEAQEQLDKLKQTLTEIKSILELYANSKVGEEQPDGTYQLSSGIGGSFGFGFGVCTTTYDPRPARQALQKISEVR